MNLELMSNKHQKTSTTPHGLMPGRAATIDAAARPRLLRVLGGRVWLTAVRSNPDDPAQDLWLQAGQQQVLPAGVAWVVEGWPQAQLSLQALPASGLSRASWAASPLAWLARMIRRAWRGPPAPC